MTETDAMVHITTEQPEPALQLDENEAFAYAVLRRAATLQGVRIDRRVFLRTELKKHCPKEVVREAISTTPQQAGVSGEVMDAVADDAIRLESNKVSALSALAGIPGGLAVIGTVPADLAQFFAHVLRIEQKLAYIYGWESFLNEDDEIDDETMYKLILFLGIMLKVGGVSMAVTDFAAHVTAPHVAKAIERQALTKTFYYPIIKKVMAAMGVKVTKSTFAAAVSKAVPVVGGVVSGGITYATFRPGAISLKNYLRLLPQAVGDDFDASVLAQEMGRQGEDAATNVRDITAVGAQETVGTIGKAIGDTVAHVGHIATDAALGAAETIEKTTGDAIGAAGQLAKNVGAGIGDAAQGAAGAAASAVDGIGHAANAAVEGVAGAAEWIAGSIGAGIFGGDSKRQDADGKDDAREEPSGADSAAIELRKLKLILDEGLITQEDYDAKKRQLLGL